MIYRLKKLNETFMTIGGSLYTIDELLTMYYGQEVDELGGLNFINHSFSQDDIARTKATHSLAEA